MRFGTDRLRAGELVLFQRKMFKFIRPNHLANNENHSQGDHIYPAVICIC